MTAVSFDAMRDKSYQRTRLGRDILDLYGHLDMRDVAYDLGLLEAINDG